MRTTSKLLDYSNVLAGFSLGTLLLSLDGQELGVDVGEDTTVGDGCVDHQSVELLVVSDGEQDVSGDDSGLLVILGGVAGQLQNFGGQILEDGGEVNGGTGSDSVTVSAGFQESGQTTNGELEAGSGGSRDLLGGGGFRLS